MKKKLLFLLALGFVGISPAIHAQFSIDAQLRNRLEIRDGYQQLAAPGDTPSTHISQRSRLIFGYKSDDLRITIIPQDVRVWGDEQFVSFSGNQGNSASLDLYEAFAELRLGESGWLSIGRQRFVYDNQSLLSDGDWSQRPGADDAIILKLNPGAWNLHLAGSWNSLAATPRDNFYPTNRFKTFNFLWANRKFENGLNLSLVHVSAGVTRTDTTNTLNFRHTTGFYTSLLNQTFDLKANVYYQWGQNQVGTDVSAILVDAEAGYRVNPNLTAGLGLGYLSGNKSVTGTTDNLFDPLYRTRHGFFGFIDHFRVFPVHTRQGGLFNGYAFFNYRVNERVSLLYRAHYFELAQLNELTPAGNYLGVENDLVVRFQPYKFAQLQAGYAFIVPSDNLRAIQGVSNGEFSQFFYLQLNLTPNLFKQ